MDAYGRLSVKAPIGRAADKALPVAEQAKYQAVEVELKIQIYMVLMIRIGV